MELGLGRLLLERSWSFRSRILWLRCLNSDLRVSIYSLYSCKSPTLATALAVSASVLLAFILIFFSASTFCVSLLTCACNPFNCVVRLCLTPLINSSDCAASLLIVTSLFSCSNCLNF